jgi:3-dehydroquinate synthase
MIFTVENTEFPLNLNMENENIIKSKIHDYKLKYSNDEPYLFFKNLYKDGDFVIIDNNVDILYSNILLDCDQNNVFKINAIEENKNVYYSLEIIDKMLERGINKKNKIIVIGGGITQDISGFISTVFKRGLEWIFIPTTLLAMTDSCIGGKIGLNHKSKNVVALFTSPYEVHISPIFLSTLDNDQIVSGLGEALKLCLTGGLETYEQFKSYYNSKNYMEIIKMSLCVKKSIIEVDEYEKNERKVLNYGHTFGHAIESATNYFIPHGIAVLIGMYIINSLFCELFNDKTKLDEINKFILSIVDKKFFNLQIKTNEILKHVASDKKNIGNKICFIILTELGKSKFIYRTASEIENQLDFILKQIFLK